VRDLISAAEAADDIDEKARLLKQAQDLLMHATSPAPEPPAGSPVGVQGAGRRE
jgi:hypothetical protein